jgi:hypothetical protein
MPEHRASLVCLCPMRGGCVSLFSVRIRQIAKMPLAKHDDLVKTVLSLSETQSVWSAVANRLMFAADVRSLQVDLVRFRWAIPATGFVGS